MEALIRRNMHLLFLPFSAFLQHVLLVRIVGAASHFKVFQGNSLQPRAAKTFVRKRKLLKHIDEIGLLVRTLFALVLTIL